MAKPSRLDVSPGGGGGARAAIKANARAAMKKTVTASPNQKARARNVARKKSSDYVASNSVKVLRPLSDVARAGFNTTSAIRASNAKSGAAARIGAAKAANRNWHSTQLGSKPKVIKINSNK